MTIPCENINHVPWHIYWDAAQVRIQHWFRVSWDRSTATPRKVVVSTPLKNMIVSWDYEIPNTWKNKKCSKPPTRYDIFLYVYIYILGVTIHICKWLFYLLESFCWLLKCPSWTTRHLQVARAAAPPGAETLVFYGSPDHQWSPETPGCWQKNVLVTIYVHYSV